MTCVFGIWKIFHASHHENTDCHASKVMRNQTVCSSFPQQVFFRVLGIDAMFYLTVTFALLVKLLSTRFRFILILALYERCVAIYYKCDSTFGGACGAFVVCVFSWYDTCKIFYTTGANALNFKMCVNSYAWRNIFAYIWKRTVVDKVKV